MVTSNIAINLDIASCTLPAPGLEAGFQPNRISCTRRIRMGIESFLRELSGPKSLRRTADTGLKPRIWNHGATTVSLEAQPTFQGGGRGTQ